MPTYEYECTECGAVTEVFQSITEPARRRLKKADSPACGCGAPVKRLIGAGAGIIFKGSGFYQTDYRSENYKKAAKADSDSGSSATAKDGSTDGGGGKDAAKTPKSEKKEPSGTARKSA